ncbi:MAG: DUF1592 domain-containing protein, partial [Verrucomicrobiota bacterium]
MKSKYAIYLHLAAIVSLAAAAEPNADISGFDKDVKPLLEKYCISCHGPDKVKAEIRVDTLNPDMFASDSGEYWEEVYNQLSIGDMPPDDEAQPTVEERETITAWVHHELRRAAELRRSTGGNNVIRRLTAYEYSNTLRDLLGIDLDYAENLPPEGAAQEGFVNNSAVLGTSGLHIEYFQRIGADAIRKAVMFGDQPEAFVLEFSPDEHLPKPKPKTDDKDEKKKKKRTPTGPIVVHQSDAAEGGVLMTTIASHAGAAAQATQPGSLIQVNTRDIPVTGPIRITIRARAENQGDGIVPEIGITAGKDAGSKARPFKVLGAVNVAGDELRDYVFDARLERFPMDPHDAKKQQFLAIQSFFDPGTSEIAEQPRVFIDSVHIEAGVYENWPPETRSNLLVSGDVRELLTNFMKRAYRRPAAAEEVDRMVALYENLRGGELSHENALIETMAAVLAAPGFLLLAEPSTESKRRPLNDWELASRLSYFLWSTMPDERLFALAEQGKLSDPSVLSAEVERMLSDENAEAFFENFASQWLDLDAIYNIAINPEFFPNFNDQTKDVMVEETIAFFTQLMKDDRSALDLIDSDDAML